MIAPYEFWSSIGLVPRCNPDGTVRGNPGPEGRGSNFDCYLTGCLSKGIVASPGVTAKTSAYHQGTVQMVIPGLLEHAANRRINSTWDNENVESAR